VIRFGQNQNLAFPKTFDLLWLCSRGPDFQRSICYELSRFLAMTTVVFWSWLRTIKQKVIFLSALAATHLQDLRQLLLDCCALSFSGVPSLPPLFHLKLLVYALGCGPTVGVPLRLHPSEGSVRASTNQNQTSNNFKSANYIFGGGGATDPFWGMGS